jgi:chromosome segregation ATPase
LTKDKEQKEE